MSTSCEVKFERLVSDGSNYSSWSAHVLNVLRTWGPSFESVVVASILPKGFDGVDESNLSNEEKECVHHNRLVIDLLSKNMSKVIWSFIHMNQSTNQSDDEESDDEDEDKSLEECNSSTNCTSPLVIPFKRQENICSTATVQENSVVPGFKTGGTGFGREQNEEASSSEKSSPHSHNKKYLHLLVVLL